MMPHSIRVALTLVLALASVDAQTSVPVSPGPPPVGCALVCAANEIFFHVATGNDSCEWAIDGTCDVPPLCAADTDATDCSGELTHTLWVIFGESVVELLNFMLRQVTTVVYMRMMAHAMGHYYALPTLMQPIAIRVSFIGSLS